MHAHATRFPCDAMNDGLEAGSREPYRLGWPTIWQHGAQRLQTGSVGSAGKGGGACKTGGEAGRDGF